MTEYSDRPEDIPEDLPPISTFTFSLENVEPARKDLRLQLEAYEERVQRLVDNVKLRGIPILTHILGVSDDEEELLVLGKAIVKLAPLASRVNELKSRLSLLDAAVENPNWFAWVFGDFNSDIDQIISEASDSEILTGE